MASFVAKVALCLIFGFFIYETINELNKLFRLSLNPYFAIIPAALVYVFQEFVIKKWKSNVKEFPVETPTEARVNKIIFFVTWLLVAGFFLGILVVWAGAIYKQIIKGSEGLAIFN